MSDEVQSGLEGVVAFATEIAEPDRDGGALRYRGVNVEDLITLSFAVTRRLRRRPVRSRGICWGRAELRPGSTSPRIHREPRATP